MSEYDELTITITAARLQERIARFTEMWRAAMPIYLGRQRHRSRLVTRNKQRRNW